MIALWSWHIPSSILLGAGVLIALSCLNLRYIGVTYEGQSVTLEPGGQFELSGAPVDTIHKTCTEVNSHLYQVGGWEVGRLGGWVVGRGGAEP